LEKAKESFQAALNVREALAARDPSDVMLAINVGNAQSRLSDVALSLDDTSGALEWCAKAIATCNEVKKRSPDDWRVGDALTQAHIVRANTLTRLGRHAEALADWERVLELHTGHGRPWYCLQKGLTLARLGEHERAAREVEEVLGESGRYSDMVIRKLTRDAANVYAVAAAAALQDGKRSEAERAALAERYAAAGVASLRRAVQNGYSALAKLNQDKDLEPLRTRDDFKDLVAEMHKQSKKESH
jgi:tetratricopeptide (TPR) repeat protein